MKDKIVTKENILNYLEAMKQGNLNITYREAFDIEEEEVEVNFNYQIPDPQTYKKFSVYAYGTCPNQDPLQEIDGNYKIKILKT